MRVDSWLVLLLVAAMLQGCAAIERRPDPVAQLEASTLTSQEREQILTTVFHALVTALHENDLPAYLRMGDRMDPPPGVIAALRDRSLRVQPHSLQPDDDSRGDGIAGTLVYVVSFRQVGSDRVVLDAGVMAGILAGTGHRFTLVRTDGEWRIEKRELTWLS